jgi:PAS domain S-box-containing protein
MILIDDDGRFTDVNPGACALFGLPRDGLLGRSAVDFAEPGFDVERVRAEYRRAGTGPGHLPPGPARRHGARDRVYRHRPTSSPAITSRSCAT